MKKKMEALNKSHAHWTHNKSDLLAILKASNYYYYYSVNSIKNIYI